jgi:trans-2,3-dihydro-3-hydroxyanthranilate isomerase
MPGMSDYAYRIVNVFALPGQVLTGNPLCVFEAASGLDAGSMQALALQFNLSETTFIVPSERGDARVRIFTPTFEMPFAGHPTLGTAHVLRKLTGKDALQLEMLSGMIAVQAIGDNWTLRANPPKARPVQASRAQLAEMLGLNETDVGEPALWVDTGSEQLMVPLTSAAALERCRPVGALLKEHGRLHEGRYLVYAFARISQSAVRARFFFDKQGQVIEDPATGSACANLGGYLWQLGQKPSATLQIAQGEHVGRPSLLSLHVDEDGRSHVGGHVIELGHGTIRLS